MAYEIPDNSKPNNTALLNAYVLSLLRLHLDTREMNMLTSQFKEKLYSYSDEINTISMYLYTPSPFIVAYYGRSSAGERNLSNVGLSVLMKVTIYSLTRNAVMILYLISHHCDFFLLEYI